MSMLLMVKAMEAKVGNPLRKLVLIKLADNANDKGECWPSYQDIADHCEIGRSTVRKHIKDLENQGLLKIENRKGIKGNTSNIYYLTLDNPIAPNSTGAIAPDSIGVARDSTPCSTSEHTLCHQIAPEPVIEPINEPVIEPNINISQIKQIFDHWKSRMNHPKARFTEDKKSKIQARLKDGFTSDQLIQAIDGCASSAWHMGAHPDNQTRYDSIALIFRNASKVEEFIERYEQSQRNYHAANDSHTTERTSEKFGSADIQNFDIYEEFGIPREGDDVCPESVYETRSDVPDIIHPPVQNQNRIHGSVERMGEGVSRRAANDGPNQDGAGEFEDAQDVRGPAQPIPAEPDGVSGAVSAEVPMDESRAAQSRTSLQGDMQRTDSVEGESSPDIVLGGQRNRHVGNAQSSPRQSSEAVHAQLRNCINQGS